MVIFVDDQKPGWRKFLSYVGPLKVSIIWYHVTVETDLQAGASHRYEVNKTLKTMEHIHRKIEKNIHNPMSTI